jgi:hypothetical protein
MPKKKALVEVRSRIQTIRGQRVILDQDLAALYQVSNKVLLQALRRHPERFPRDFVFRLESQEFSNLRLQIEAASSWGGRRDAPYAFTAEGVAMLSGLLNSPRAIAVNIDIMRTFVRLKDVAGLREYASKKIDALEKRVDGHDLKFVRAFEALETLLVQPEAPKRRIGFGRDEETGALKGKRQR